VAMPNSSVKSVKDMAGKKVAVTSASSISAILIMSTLKTNGVEPTSVKWVPLPFPDTAARLQAGDLDAAFLTEPFLTSAQKTVGAVPVFDTATGPTANFPTAGWAATGIFVKNNPGTVAKFQRAMLKATNEARSDRSKVEPLLVQFSKVDQDTAKLATLLTFQSTLDATRIQRVPDLMLEFKLINNKVAVEQMIVKSPSSS
jgi:NitT/TauT family transport system substrate-binding protein